MLFLLAHKKQVAFILCTYTNYIEEQCLVLFFLSLALALSPVRWWTVCVWRDFVLYEYKYNTVQLNLWSKNCFKALMAITKRINHLNMTHSLDISCARTNHDANDEPAFSKSTHFYMKNLEYMSSHTHSLQTFIKQFAYASPNSRRETKKKTTAHPYT